MPKFVIERQYLVPMYQHIVVEAENLEEVPSTMWRTSCLSRRPPPSTAVEGARGVRSIPLPMENPCSLSSRTSTPGNTLPGPV